MADDDADALGDDALVRDAKAERDVVGDVMRANVRRNLFGTDSEPTKIGRFTVVGSIGSGAMGSVVAAYDPVLDRKVAVKLLRTSGRDELLAEARALAKLSHPHVVTVHEADVVGSQVYIAMEFVRGPNLRAWLDAAPRAWDEITRVFGEAAQGLAAAHDAGLVHADFKPGNVLVGEDGVRVADFGMARLADGEAGGTGGTPAYLAPERWRGEPASPLSDQFAFGVALYEAVYDATPFGANSLPRTATESIAALDTPTRIPADHRGAPAWLDALVLRALALDPEARHPSMAALAKALARERRRRGPMIAGIAAATGAAIGVAYYGGVSRDPCGASDEALGVIWNGQTAAAMRRSWARVDSAFVDDAAQRVDAGLTRYAAAWTAVHRDTCEATRIRGEQSDSMYDLRMRCLQRLRGQLRALTEAVQGRATAKAVAQAVTAVEELPPPAACRAETIADNAYPEPADPEQRQTVETIRAQIDAAWARYGLGDYPGALRDATAAVDAAEQAGYPPLTAEAHYRLGAIQSRASRPSEAEATLADALLEAAALDHDPLGAEIALALLRTVLFAGEPARVVAMADVVRATVARARRDPHEVDGIVGEALLNQGDAMAAAEALERALQHETRPGRVAILQVNLASAHLALGRADRALSGYESALSDARAHFGPAHPSVGFYLQRLGRGQRAAGELDAARQTLEAALRIRTEALGPRDRAVGSTQLDLAQVLFDLGDDGARRHARDALAIRDAEYGAEHPRLVDPLVLLGRIASDGGDPALARAHWTRAATILNARSPEHPTLAIVERLLGDDP
ncbi:MAG: serine/threonine-protein kinase [Myxococcota bacterium]